MKNTLTILEKLSETIYEKEENNTGLFSAVEQMDDWCGCRCDSDGNVSHIVLYPWWGRQSVVQSRMK